MNFEQGTPQSGGGKEWPSSLIIDYLLLIIDKCSRPEMNRELSSRPPQADRIPCT